MEKSNRSAYGGENGIPVYSVEIIPGSMGMVGIPESIEKLDGSQFHGLARFWYETAIVCLSLGIRLAKEMVLLDHGTKMEI